MEYITTMNFINKTISKTTERTLNWTTLPEDYSVKLLPAEKEALELPFPDDYELSRSYSFVAPFKSGHILMLIYKENAYGAGFNPPSNCKISLRVQEESSIFPIEIANNETSLHSSDLIRLYNLIVEKNSTIHTLIDDFLNS